MANLIITVIAIALVAVASLMGAYYGGSAFLQGTAQARAATLAGQGQQLAGAVTFYANREAAGYGVTALSQLVPTYLIEIPTPPSGAGTGLDWTIGQLTDASTGVGSSTPDGVWTIGDLNDDVCEEASNNVGAATDTPTGDDYTPSATYNCVIDGTDSTAHFVYQFR